MATTTDTLKYEDTSNRGGVYPSDSRTGVYQDVDTDNANLGVINDVLRMISLAPGTRLADAGLEMGDHDAHATPTCTHSLIYNDGTTSHEIAKASTIGQGGGTVRAGGGTAPDRVPTTALTAKGWLGIKTIAAPATAQTASRYVRVWILLEAVS